MANGDIHQGGCLCGALRYRAVVGESRTVTHCHCRMCRKATGGSFVTWVEFPAGDFVYTKGRPRYFRSSEIARRAFCENCGGQLVYQSFTEAGDLSDAVWVALGGLDRPGDIAPTDHIFTADQLPWLHLDDGLKRWPGQLPWLRSDDSLSRPAGKGD